ncbi:MAG: L,D-transpeptidase [Marinobacter sp.]|nr:L,D-transpeptidase [Marinobacter sp.]
MNSPKGSFPHLHISIASQSLTLIGAGGESLFQFPVSTALNGPGEQNGSGCTPRGRHYVRAMVGDSQPQGTVFVARRPTGEIHTPELAARYPERDWILSRILWLCGCESGINRGPGVDSFRRFIYIHGTPDTEPMGEPRSHGCIRMRNSDVIRLYDLVTPGTTVTIEES